MIRKHNIKYDNYSYLIYYAYLCRQYTIFFLFPYLFVGKQGRLWWLMASQTCLVLFLCWFMTQILFIFYWCDVTPLNGFRKHAKRINTNHRWYVMLTFCVWMWTTCTTKTWTRLTSVIKFIMCTKLTTGCKSTSGGGLFYLDAMASYFSMRTLFTKHFVKRERWSPWAITSFGIFFAWRRSTPKLLVAAIIWF